MLWPPVFQLTVDVAEIPQHPGHDRPATTPTHHAASSDTRRPNLTEPPMQRPILQPASRLLLRRPRRARSASIAAELRSRVTGHKRATATGAHPNFRREPVPARPCRSRQPACRTNPRSAPVAPPLPVGTRPKLGSALLTKLHGSPPTTRGEIWKRRGSANSRATARYRPLLCVRLVSRWMMRLLLACSCVRQFRLFVR
jgi:hypothetical protein